LRRWLTTLLGAIMGACVLAALVFAHVDLELYRTTPEGAVRWNLRVAGPMLGAFLSLALLAFVHIGRLLRFVRSSRSFAALNVGLSVVAALAIVVLVNLISSRQYARFDLTASGAYSVSDRTRETLGRLARLTGPVTAYAFVRSAHPWFATLKGLLDTYAEYGGDHLQVRYLHPGRDLERFERTTRSLGIDPRDVEGSDVVILAGPALGDALPRTRVIPLAAMIGGARSPSMRAFRGEEELTRALHAVTRERQPRVLLLQGHREMDRTASEPERRLDAFARALENLDYAVDTLRLAATEAGTAQLPEGADVLVIAGAQGRLTDPELDAIRGWLDAGGRLLVLAEPQVRQRPGTTSAYFATTRIEEVLAPYGLGLGQAIVFDEATVTPLGVFSLRAPIGGERLPPHPISRPLDGLELWVHRALPVTVDHNAAAAGGVRVQPLSLTLSSALALEDLDAFNRTGNPYDARHTPGVVCLAAAASRVKTVERPAPGSGAPADDEANEAGDGPPPVPLDTVVTRIVVVGDATFTSDALAEHLHGNLNLAVNAVGWLAERDETISIAAKPPAIIRLRLDQRDKLRLWLLSLLDLPGACALIGLLVWRARRR
jgi:ABC-type uncharacterized transport system involved in gliding motility auxiliary subunit